MKHCKRILLLVVVMVIVLAGLSCTAFASEMGAEDWRIEGNNGEAVTLYPGLEFSTQNTTLVPSWTQKVSGVDKNVFENAYFDKANKLLFLKVNEKLTSNTKTTLKLEGSWFRSKTITVYVNVGPKYLPNLTLLQGEERMAILPYGVKSVEVMAGRENVLATIQGDYVRVKGLNEGTARISVQYYSDNTRTSIEAYEFKVGVVEQKVISIVNAGKHIPLPTLGFAPDTPFEQVYGSAKGMEIIKGHKHGYIFSSTCLKLSKDVKDGDTFKLIVPMDVWRGVNNLQEPEGFYLVNSKAKDIKLYIDEKDGEYYSQLLVKCHIDYLCSGNGKIEIGGKDIDKIVVESPILSAEPFSLNAMANKYQYGFIQAKGRNYTSADEPLQIYSILEIKCDSIEASLYNVHVVRNDGSSPRRHIPDRFRNGIVYFECEDTFDFNNFIFDPNYILVQRIDQNRGQVVDAIGPYTGTTYLVEKCSGEFEDFGYMMRRYFVL